MHAYLRGAEKELEDENGRTPLLTAAASGKTEALVKLLENGADVEAVDNNDKNIVYFIVKQGHINMLTVRNSYHIAMHMSMLYENFMWLSWIMIFYFAYLCVIYI